MPGTTGIHLRLTVYCSQANSETEVGRRLQSKRIERLHLSVCAYVVFFLGTCVSIILFNIILFKFFIRMTLIRNGFQCFYGVLFMQIVITCSNRTAGSFNLKQTTLLFDALNCLLITYMYKLVKYLSTLFSLSMYVLCQLILYMHYRQIDVNENVSLRCTASDCCSLYATLLSCVGHLPSLTRGEASNQIKVVHHQNNI